MGARLVDPREILCKMHATQLLLYVCVCTKFRTGQLFYYGVAILKSSVTWPQWHAINVTRLVKKSSAVSLSTDVGMYLEVRRIFFVYHFESVEFLCGHLVYIVGVSDIYNRSGIKPYGITLRAAQYFNLIKPTGYVMHQQV